MVCLRSLGFIARMGALICCVLIVTSCAETTDRTVSADQDSKAYLLEGKKLSVRYCTSCHMYAPPELLPKHIWKEEVLPRMGAFHGIYEKESRNALLEGGEARSLLLKANVYPVEATIDSTDWIKIKNYILKNAPDELSNHPVKLEAKEFFEIETPKARISPPMSTMVQYESGSGLIYHGDVKKDYSTINIFDADLAPVQSLGIRSPAVRIEEKNNDLWALLMGSFTSTDAPSGSVAKFSKTNGSEEYNTLKTVIEGLQRPVDMAFADFDNDGDEDVVIAQFGNWAGRLEWFENIGEEQYKRHLLFQKTGSSKVVAEDLDDDGLTDILVMVAQGDESIYALINQGAGKFNSQKLLQLPPTYGSVTFEYLDIDNDGRKDIIHVAGDNADYEAILKPYHGVRVFKGSDNLVFEEVYFHPVHGAYKALPADFDGDGDLDIGVISFFPDYSDSAKESLMMLENKSVGDSLVFEGFALPGYGKGRWNVMDSGDVNQDGAPDLILGSFVIKDPYSSQQDVKTQWLRDSPMLMVLKNQWQ